LLELDGFCKHGSAALFCFVTITLDLIEFVPKW
jgi:hypothetical protein